MSNHLVQCPECDRHVRAFESDCPFCAGVLPPFLRASAPSKGAPAGLARTAILAFGISAMAGGVGCGDDDRGTQVPVYGGPNIPPPTPVVVTPPVPPVVVTPSPPMPPVVVTPTPPPMPPPRTDVPAYGGPPPR